MEQNLAVAAFIQALDESLQEQTFVKLTLSKNRGALKDLKNIYGRLATIGGSAKLVLVERFETKDVTKNYDIPEGIPIIQEWLGASFLNADLWTTQADYSLQFNKKRKARLFEKAPAITTPPSREHDHQKSRLIPADRPYLSHLGISNEGGSVLKSGQKKFKQINRYIELLDQMMQQVDFPKSPRVVDMGSGKGYLTFALYDHLRNNLQLQPEMTGIELRPALVEAGNQLAAALDFSTLHFHAGDIMEYQVEQLDLLIALHACDIATDLAIAKGIQANARMIVVAPCCHKQIRKEMACQSEMQAILQHGILEERQAELITDGMRALLMESRGYKTKIMEFISTEHTPKNLMIVGIQSKQVKKDALDQIDRIKNQFGIQQHYLESLLEKI